MRKLLFCDLDGTLLPRGEKSISRDVLAQIDRIISKGNIFAVASGRSYDEMRALFGPVSQKIVFVCLDGAIAFYRDCVIYKMPLCKIEAGKLSPHPTNATVFGRTKTLCFDEKTPDNERTRLINTLGSEVFKLSVSASPQKSQIARVCYNRDGICEYVNKDANKGVAAKAVAKKFSILPENTIAVGDGENDIQLLSAVSHPYKMADCHISLKDFPAKQVTDILEFLKNI